MFIWKCTVFWTSLFNEFTARPINLTCPRAAVPPPSWTFLYPALDIIIGSRNIAKEMCGAALTRNSYLSRWYIRRNNTQVQWYNKCLFFGNIWKITLCIGQLHPQRSDQQWHSQKQFFPQSIKYGGWYRTSRTVQLSRPRLCVKMHHSATKRRTVWQNGQDSDNEILSHCNVLSPVLCSVLSHCCGWSRCHIPTFIALR